VKFSSVAVLAAFLLCGCQERLSLEQAQERCTQQGGFLVIIYEQQVSLSGGAGPETASPGSCVMPDKFDIAEPAPSTPPAPAR